MPVVRIITRETRWPGPAWAVVLVVAWLGLVAAYEALARSTGEEGTLCLFRRVTDVPCPTCGVTRGVLALGRGDVLGAFALNPLIMTLGLLGVAWLVVRVGWKRSVVLDLTRQGRWVTWSVVGVLVVVNWAYVVWRDWG